MVSLSACYASSMLDFIHSCNKKTLNRRQQWLITKNGGREMLFQCRVTGLLSESRAPRTSNRRTYYPTFCPHYISTMISLAFLLPEQQAKIPMQTETCLT